MTTLTNLIQAFHNEEEGATATEYIIMVVLIACFLITMIGLFGEAVGEKFTESTSDVSAITSASN